MHHFKAFFIVAVSASNLSAIAGNGVTSRDRTAERTQVARTLERGDLSISLQLVDQQLAELEAIDPSQFPTDAMRAHHYQNLGFFRYNRANILGKQGFTDDAIGELNEALEAYENSRAIAGENSEAADSSNRAYFVSLDEAAAEGIIFAQESLAKLYLDLNLYGEAEHILDEIIRRGNPTGVTYFHLANLYLETQDFEASRSYARQGLTYLDDKKREAQVGYLIGLIDMLTGQLEVGFRLLQRVPIG